MQLKEVGFDPLLGLGGSAWMIERGLTFTVFVTTLYAMPRSKAVGQCGFLVQLLRRFERGGEMQRLFYDAIMTDFATASLPASWSHVVYALLIKPPPSDASIVAERRYRHYGAAHEGGHAERAAVGVRPGRCSDVPSELALAQRWPGPPLPPSVAICTRAARVPSPVPCS